MVKYKRIKTQKPKPKPKKNHRKTTKKNGGFGERRNNADIEQHYSELSCPDAKVPCKTFDTYYQNKQNEIWKTCITTNGMKNHIIYVTQDNVVIKSVETAQIPVFTVSLSKGPPINCNIMIEDRFVNCFLFICNEWYAMMRMFGKTKLFNTGFFARTEKFKVFYKLKNIIVNSTTGVIEIPNGAYTDVTDERIKNYVLHLSTEKSRIINLKDCEWVNKENSPKVFKVLQAFRQHKLLGNALKEEAMFRFWDLIT